MCAHGKVLNISTNQRIKRSQARNRVEQCLSAWVEDGLSIRDLTLAERVAARSEQARLRALEAEVLTGPEVGGCRFVRPDTTAYRVPWTAIEAMYAPMMIRKCHWPKNPASA